MSKSRKTSFIIKRDEVTNGRTTMVPSLAVLAGVGVNGLIHILALEASLFTSMEQCKCKVNKSAFAMQGINH